MVKFQKHTLKQHNKYKKNKIYEYEQFSLDFPFEFNEEIRPHMTKIFDIAITTNDSPKQETINILLVRKKTAQEAGNHKLFEH